VPKVHNRDDVPAPRPLWTAGRNRCSSATPGSSERSDSYGVQNYTWETLLSGHIGDTHVPGSDPAGGYDPPAMNPRVRLNVWSGPRNVSTALMYAFAQRSDARVVDEPLYAHYLRVTGADHPGRDLVLAAQENDGEKVVEREILGPCDRPLVMFKQMAHHLVALDRSFLSKTTNVLLTRDPEEMLTSLVANIPEPTLRDTGYAAQTEILAHLVHLGRKPVVLVAHRILQDPEGVLRKLCERVDIAFDPAMLTWTPGARPEDGVWAPFWYANVHRSSGFQEYVRKAARVPERLRPLLATCREHYARLVEHAD